MKTFIKQIVTFIDVHLSGRRPMYRYRFTLIMFYTNKASTLRQIIFKCLFTDKKNNILLEIRHVSKQTV